MWIAAKLQEQLYNASDCPGFEPVDSEEMVAKVAEAHPEAERYSVTKPALRAIANSPNTQ